MTQSAKAARIIKRLRALFPEAGMRLRYRNHWQLLVAVILSAQTTDKKVNQVTATLFKKYKTPDDYIRAGNRDIAQAVRSLGLYRTKAKNIVATAKIVRNSYRGRLPKNMAEMIRLPGVGRKTANVVLGNAFGVVEGIAVDTHVARLSKQFGLTEHSDPRKIEQDLMAALPHRDWFMVTYLLIDYGRKYCPARSHDHERCPLRDLEK
jgi:endonuclease-3